MHASLEESLRSAVESYRGALTAVGDAGAKAYPPAGDDLKQSLLQLRQSLGETTSPSVFADTEQRVSEQLKSWAESAAHYYQDSADEIKSLLLEVAKAAAEVGARDQRYGERLHTLASRLETAAKLDNLAAMRQSLSANAIELASCVNKMSEEGKRAVDQLRAQVSSYQERMEEAERQASVDALTGVSTRRIVERQLENRVRDGAPFCVVYLDLNEFKQINDTLGHPAGDELLKQFAGDLRHSLRTADCVGRFGGDEFVVLMDGPLETVRARIDLVSKHVNGDYTLSTGTGKRKVSLTAAAGIAEWKPGCTAQQVLMAADRAMYEDKKRGSEARRVAPVALKV